MTTNKNLLTRDVIILGAGAAGLFCAITAAQRGRTVLIIEKSNKVGKKILMSGGGRCNFTNRQVDAKNFISQNIHFCKSALTRYSSSDFIELVEQHGIDYEERRHGQLFCKNTAKYILEMLLSECDRLGVKIKTGCEIISIESLQSNSRYGITIREKNKSINKLEECESFVVATGGLSIPTLGGSGIGYDIAQQFSLPLIERRAGLVPFMFSDSTQQLFERLSGLALEVTVSCNKQTFTENVLFTHRGLSGPVMLQSSNYWQPGDELHINLLPNFLSVKEFQKSLIKAKQNMGKSLLKTVLHQHLAKSLVSELQTLWWPAEANKPLAEFSGKQLSVIAENLMNWKLKPSATEGYRTAEVTLGGVDTNNISSKTMEAKQQPGLYFVGEVLDVSGHLGGFNFQWAWSSGYSAGMFV